MTTTRTAVLERRMYEKMDDFLDGTFHMMKKPPSLARRVQPLAALALLLAILAVGAVGVSHLSPRFMFYITPAALGACILTWVLSTWMGP